MSCDDSFYSYSYLYGIIGSTKQFLVLHHLKKTIYNQVTNLIYKKIFTEVSDMVIHIWFSRNRKILIIK